MRTGLALVATVATALAAAGCSGSGSSSSQQWPPPYVFVPPPVPQSSVPRSSDPQIPATQAAAAPPTRSPTPPPPAGPPPFFPEADWLWKPIPPNPALAPESATWVGYLSAPGAPRVADLFRYGVTLVPESAITADTPRYDVALSEPWGADLLAPFSVPIPIGTRIPPGTDGQIAILDPVTGQAFGLWQAKYDEQANTWSASWGGVTPLDGDGIVRSGSATATDIARFAGVIGAEEFTAAIAADTGLNHALVFSTDIAGPTYVAPAIKSDGTNIAGVALPIPEGSRVQLDPSIDIDAIPGITRGGRVVAKTLQTHGAYVVDKGRARMAFPFEVLPTATSTNPGTAWTRAGFAWDYFAMTGIPWSSLRVIAP